LAGDESLNPLTVPSFPNLLRTRKGRLAGFFLLYVSEGLPQGFTGVAVSLEFKRLGMTAEAIGTFLAVIMLPWAWKWVAGPLVDNLHFKFFGRRKQWIVFTQTGMLVTLAAALCFFPKAVTGADGVAQIVGLSLFSGVLLAHNIFAACQDVAIDALACDTLPEHERGVANGLMFAGAQLGAAVGGSGVLFLKGVFGFSMASLVVPLLLVGLMLMVVVGIFENRLGQVRDVGAKGGNAAVTAKGSPVDYILTVFRVFFLTRRGFMGLLLAVVPAGGMALSLTASTVISPLLGMNDNEIATMGLASSLVFTFSCVAGGYLSDLMGRRRALVLFSLGTLLPTVWIGWKMGTAGWLHPPPTPAGGLWPRQESIIFAWWIAGMAYSLFNGLMYGIRTAFFMDIIEPKVAATQFTACMALLNLVIIYSYWWEGKAITPVAEGGWGFTFPQIFYLDAALGTLFLIPLWLIGPRRHAVETVEEAVPVLPTA